MDEDKVLDLEWLIQEVANKRIDEIEATSWDINIKSARINEVIKTTNLFHKLTKENAT